MIESSTSSFPGNSRPLDIYSFQTEQRLKVVVLSGLATAVLIGLVALYVDPEPFTVAIPVVVAILMAPMYLALQKGMTRTVSIGIVCLGLVAITTAYFVNQDGIRDSASTILVLLLVFSSTFLDKRAVSLFGGLSIAIVCFAWLLEHVGVLHTDFPEPPGDGGLVLLTGICFSTILLRSSLSQRIRTFTQLRTQIADLEAENDLLAQQVNELTLRNHVLSRERRQRDSSETARRRADKQQIVSTLAGGVVHDFNNVLTSLIAQSTLALYQLPAGDPARPDVEQTIETATNATEITRQLSCYAGKQPKNYSRVELKALIEQHQSELLGHMKDGQRLEFQLAEGLSRVEVERTAMQHALEGLVSNASEAIEHDDGRIVVSTHECWLGQDAAAGLRGEVCFQGHLAAGAYVCLGVKDNGKGMDTMWRHRIFDPYYSNKKGRRGLGLCHVVGIVRATQGAVTVESDSHFGSHVRLYMPITNPISPDGRIEESIDQDKKSGVVLVIDDEHTIRESVGRILRRSGYSVLTAENGERGLAAFKQAVTRIRLVILDVQMPGLNGYEVFRKMRKLAPEIPVIFSSGYTNLALHEHLRGEEGYSFLSKPFRIASLLELVRRHDDRFKE